MNTVARLSFQEIPSIPQLVKDHLKDMSYGANSFNGTKETVSKAIHQKLTTYSEESRAVLYQVLVQQHECLDVTFSQKENLKLIALSNTVTITTGHQLNFFTGPVFFIYKIIQILKTAKDLKAQYPEYNFVPIFWMATEDHDFEEIQHFITENNQYSIQAQSGGAVGRILLENVDFLHEIEKEWTGKKYGKELIDLLKTSYQKGDTLEQSKRKLVHHLFKDFGLLLLDGDNPLLKKSMIPYFENELLNHELEKLTENKRALLKNKYGKVQVNPREINLFYLTNTRNRIVLQNGDYHVLNKNIHFTKDEILNELNNFPEKFSPNAVLRPIYQEVVLPNIMYIGGNAEVAYWLELSDYFKKIQIPFPILVPRNSMLYIAEKDLKKIHNLHCELKDFFENKNEVLSHKLLKSNPIHTLLHKLEDHLQQQFEALKENAKHAEVSFGQLVEAEEVRQLKSFKKMKTRLLKAEKKKNTEWTHRFTKLWEKLHPNGQWQERQMNFSVFYSDFGQDWLKVCYEEMQINQSELVVVAYSF